MKTKKQWQTPDPWASMERLFGRDFPFSGLSQSADMNPEWLERIIHEATHSQSIATQDKELYKHSLYETHKSIIVRIKLPPSLNPELLRVYAGATSLRIEGLPDDSEKKVRLPCEVKSIGIRSSYKDGILEVRMIKLRSSDQERQINITIL